ncbi:hypothetical protein QN277_027877 [Acacia crassicarpa]|uniref:Remorin C-terminal domain-containing protein n=1 Tax=Acacia crassicarpa TaxID=499986 RepID=A0AAE1MCK7_9FABA|nr:hypothetical protein QN277_027877 [Acacia crassicarpa]
MKKSPVSNQKGGSLAPNYRDGSQRGWSSERVAQGAMSSRRHSSLAGLTPFNSGRALPSKWDEAERWICSPVSGSVCNNNNNTKASSHGYPHRRPKSKSGPIVPPPNGMAFYSNYSPTVPLIEGLGIKNLMVASPFSTGVLAPDAFSVHHLEVDNGVQCPCPTVGGIGLMPLCNAPRWSDLLCDPSSPNSQEERDDDDSKNDSAEMSPISKRDKGTQMSSESEDGEHLQAISSPALVTDQQSRCSAKLEVRDVEVDSQAPIIRWSKRHATKMTRNASLQAKNFRETRTEAEAEVSSWDIVAVDSTINSSKVQRDEANINAWENLQKAKAEAAIRKLEMKLEKKRSASMNKILNKLRWAQMKAEKMRGSTPEKRGHRTMKIFKFAQIWPRRSCFSSHDL